MVHQDILYAKSIANGDRGIFSLPDGMRLLPDYAGDGQTNIEVLVKQWILTHFARLAIKQPNPKQFQFEKLLVVGY